MQPVVSDVSNFELLFQLLGNYLLKIRYWFDWIYINPKLMIFILLTTRPATVKISISLKKYISYFVASDKTNKIELYQILRSLANYFKLENHTAQDTILFKWNKFFYLLLFYNTWTKRTKTHIHTYTYAHTYAHTQVRSFAVWRKFKTSTLLLSRNFKGR